MRKFDFLGLFCLISLTLITLQGQFVYGQEEVRIGLGSITMTIHEINCSKNSRTLAYPREYSVFGSMGCMYGGGFVIAAKDFEARWYYPDGTKNPGLDDFGWTYVGDGNTSEIIPYFALDATTSYYQDKLHTTIPVKLMRYWKHYVPMRKVDDEDFSTPDWTAVDEVNSNIISEHMAVATCNTSLGISLTQRAYAFANPDYDDFIIVEYIFKNTGNIDADSEIEYPENHVDQCYIGLKFVPKPSGLTGEVVGNSGGWNEGNDDWIDYYGKTYTDWTSGGTGDSLRVIYGWDGDASSAHCSFDDEGDPLPSSGIFMSPQYPGMAILHVDKTADNHSDDPTQPVISYYSWGGHICSNQLSVVNASLGQNGIWNKLKSDGYFASPFDWDEWYNSQGVTELWALDADDGNPNYHYYKTGTLGFGPYDFSSIGDSIRIVTCYTVGSIGWANAIELGEKWKKGEISKNEKNWLLRSGRDSLFAKVSRVRSLFRRLDGTYDFSMESGSTIDQKISDPPLWPDLMIFSGIEKVRLQWSNVGADSYRIYKRLKPEFYLDDPQVETYPLVYEGSGSVTEWVDTMVTPGQNYWYCLTAVKDGVESSRFVTRTNPTSSSPFRGSATVYTEQLGAPEKLDRVNVVPNPYHVHATRLYDWTQNRINFVGLPAACRIRIYTQTGDLVATLKHEYSMPPSTMETWLQLTESDQYIASGMYIYVIDQTKDNDGNDTGLKKIGKFVVIR